MAARLYVVEDDGSMTIVRAVSEAKALQHVVKGQFKVRIAKADDVAEYMGQGGEVEVSEDLLSTVIEEQSEETDES